MFSYSPSTPHDLRAQGRTGRIPPMLASLFRHICALPACIISPAAGMPREDHDGGGQAQRLPSSASPPFEKVIRHSVSRTSSCTYVNCPCIYYLSAVLFGWSVFIFHFMYVLFLRHIIFLHWHVEELGHTIQA